LDVKWSKGHYRRAKALCGCKRYADAVLAYEEVLQLEPSNADAKKESQTAQESAIKYAEELAATKASKPHVTQAHSVFDDVPKPKEKKEKKVSSESTESSKVVNADDDEITGNIRGYQVLADGRKTSFFHHEMSAEERELLGYDETGNLKPKAISAEEAKRIEKEQSQKAGEGSVWAGNTWEDRKLDSWVGDRLTALLLPCVVSQDLSKEHPEASIKVKGLKNESTASIYVKLGKKRYLYDLNFTVEYEASGFIDSGLGGNDIRGEISFKDILPDDISDGEAAGQHKLTDGNANVTPFFKKLMENPKLGLHKMIIDQLAVLHKEFHDM